MTVGELARNLEKHEGQAENRFKSIEEKLDSLIDQEKRHDTILQQVSGGIKVLKFLGWVITGGFLTTVAVFWKRFVSIFGV